jgi:hypothetical protein
MMLVIVKSGDENLVRRALAQVDGLELLPGVYLSWLPRERVARAIEAIKRDVIKRWEEAGRGPTLEVAAIELTDEQYRELRPLAKSAIERLATDLLREVEALLERMRSALGSGRRERLRELAAQYRRLARRYEWLANASLALGIEPTVMGRLREKWKEASLEAGRVLRGR